MKKFIQAGVAVSVALLALTLNISRATSAVTSMAPTGNMIYFVMLDRFANGDKTNDSGDASGFSSGGYNASDSGYYHGGDIKGLSEKIPYIKGLGFNTIWVTPIMRQVTFSGGNKGSTGYHGYWISGFDQVDPHLGTMDQFKSFVDSAHSAGIRVVLDIVTNHTTDAIRYSNGDAYVDSIKSPWKTKDGKTFSAATVAGTSSFPAVDNLSLASFPKTVTVLKGYENVKSPAWLNDVRNYHNRGCICENYVGEQSQYGDFYGLDDLFTESPVVVNGMITIFSDWIKNTGVDGFRIDTTRHVNKEFWQTFLPAMRTAATGVGKSNFPMFGEVFDTEPTNTSYWIKNGGFTEMLDFPFQSAASDYVQYGLAESLADVFNKDDMYISAKSTADQLGTFLGNHDMGRIGSFIASTANSSTEALSKAQLAHALMFLVRGNPVVYYGDEFGLQGGGDKEARQDLFPTGVSSWKTQPRIGASPIATKSSFDTTNPLQTTIRTLTSLRNSYPVLSTGTQQTRYASNGVYIATRFDATDRREYLIAFNASATTKTQTISVPTVGATWTKLAGSGTVTNSAGKIVVTLPKFSWGLLRSGSQIPIVSPTALSVTVTKPIVDTLDSSLLYTTAKIAGSGYASVELQASADGKTWQSLGVDRSQAFSAVVSQSGFYSFKPARTLFNKSTVYQFRVVATGVGGATKISAVTSMTPR